MTHQSIYTSRLFQGILVVDIVLLIVTLFRMELAAAGGGIASLRQLSLSGEHNLASWWSGSLLLLGALHAADGYFLHRRTQPQWARAWAFLALILLALSADEVGSLHERADQFLHAGAWVSLVPFALIALAAVAIMLRTLWSVPGGRSAAWLVTLGFGCLAAVVPQEYFEHKLEWQGWAKAVRGVVEEGFELAGFMLLLAAAMPNSLGMFSRSKGSAVSSQAQESGPLPAFDAIGSLRRWLSVGGIVLGLGFAALAPSLTDHGRGRPSDWPPAVLFGLAALAANRDLIRRGVVGVRELLAGGLALFASVTMVALLPRHTLALPLLQRSVSLRMTLVQMAALGAVALLAVPGHVLRRPAWAIAGAIAILALGAACLAFSPTGLASYAIPTLLAVLVFDVWARAAWGAGRQAVSLGQARRRRMALIRPVDMG